MSSSELYRQSMEAFNRRNWEAFVALMDEEVDAVSRLTQIEGGYHGLSGVRRFWDDLLRAIPDYVLEMDEIRDLGGFSLAHGRGLATDKPLVDAIWHACEWRNGKCLWWQVFMTEAEALEAIEARR